MYNQNQNFGHFGAPNYLSGPSIADWASEAQQSAQEELDMYATSDNSPSPLDFMSSRPSYTVPTYVRSGQALPLIEDGATDALVKQVTGIQGLVSKIQQLMGLKATGELTDDQIKGYQESKGLSADGIIGPNTYAKLGMGGPYQRASRSATPAQKSEIAIGDPRPWYKKPTNIAMGAGALLFLGIGAYLIFKDDNEEGEEDEE